jgi:drug/metabolite transporter (DMT)-like permease
VRLTSRVTAPTGPLKTRLGSSLLVITAAILFAFNGIVSKLVLEAGMSPLMLTTIRSISAALLLLFVNEVRPGRRPSIAWRELRMVVAYGVTGFLLVPMTYFIAIRSLPVGLALLIEFQAPVLVALWATFVRREPSGKGIWWGLGLSATGLLLVSRPWRRFALDPLGVASAIAASVSLAASFITGAAAAATRKDPLSLTLWAFAIAGSICFVVTPWWALDPSLLMTRTHGFPLWLLCLDIVLLGTIVPYLLLIEGLRRLPTTSVGLIGMLEPAIATGLAWIILNEKMELVQVIGGVVVLVGVGAAELTRLTNSLEGVRSVEQTGE